MKKIIIGCFYAFALSPLAYYPWSTVPFVIPKLVFFYTIASLFIVIYIALAAREPLYRPEWNALTVSVALFGILMIVTSFTGVDWRQSLWSFPDRGIGVLAWVFACIIIIAASGMKSFVPWRNIFAVLVYMSVIIAGTALFFGFERPGGFMGSPNFLAAYLTLAGCIAAWLAVHYYKTYKAYFFFLIAALDFLVVIVTQTRASLLALLFGLVVVCMVYGFQHHNRWAVFGALFLIGCGLLFALTRTSPVWQGLYGLERFSGSFAELSAGRVIASQAAVQGILEKPIIGWGWENFDTVFNRFYKPTYARLSAEEAFFSKPHNLFLEYAVAGGIPLLIAFLFVFWFFARRLGISWIGFIAVYSIQSFFLFDSYGSFIIFILVGAYAAARSCINEPQTSLVIVPPPHFLYRWGVLGIILLFFLYYVPYGLARDDWYTYRAFAFARSRDFTHSFSSWDRARAGSGPYADFIYKTYLSFLGDLARFSELRSFIAPRTMDAFAAVDGAIRRRPQSYLFRVIYADAAASLATVTDTHLSSAEAYLAESLRLSPDRQQSYYVQAKLALARGNRAQAFRYMEEAVVLDPLAPHPYFMSGFIAFAADDLARGIRLIEQARALGRDARDAHEARIIADAYGDLGRYDEALRYYDRALAFDPLDTETMHHQQLVEKYRARGL